MEETGSPDRTWPGESETLLSLLSCVVPEKEAVFASSEFLTGKRFYDLCLEHEVRTREELEKKLGSEYAEKLLMKNEEQGMAFAKRLREHGHKFVFTPVVFEAVHLLSWSRAEYMSFWNLLIAKKCHTVCFNEFWQFSDSCVFHYISGLKAGKKLLDHAGNFLVLDAARKMVLSATRRLEDFGFDLAELDEALRELRSFSSMG